MQHAHIRAARVIHLHGGLDATTSACTSCGLVVFSDTLANNLCRPCREAHATST